MSELEIRQFGFRAARPTINADNKLSGRAAPFNSPTLIGTQERGFREFINPKAFNKTIADGDQVLLDNHDAHRPLARRSAGTLELHAGPKGVDWRAVASNTSYAADIVENVRAGLYGGCSFSFEVVSERWDEDTADGIPERELVELKCREISIVTFPAYEDTDVYARSVDIGLEYRMAYWGRIMEGEDRRDEERGPKPYGDVKYADPKNGKYPIDTVAHIHAAWAYINVAKNAAKYPLNGVTVSEVKARIKAAAKAHGIKISEGEDAAAPQFTYETDDFQLSTRGEWSPEQWETFAKELSWLNKTSGFGPDGEPDESTRSLTKDETARLAERGEALRRERAARRRDSFR